MSDEILDRHKVTGNAVDLVAIVKAAVEGNVAVFYPCECDQHESGYGHFVDQLTAAFLAAFDFGEGA